MLVTQCFLRYDWLDVLGFKATLTDKVIPWRSVTHMFPGFLTPVLTRISFQSRGERRKYAGKKVRLNRISNSQPPGHESDMLTTEPQGRGFYPVKEKMILCVIFNLLSTPACNLGKAKIEPHGRGFYPMKEKMIF